MEVENKGLKVIVIGGVAGGASAAAKLRRLDESAKITIFEKGPHVSFANCGLPYYIGNVITDKDELLIQTPFSLKQRFNIDVKVNHEVVKIDRQQKLVVIKDLINKTESNESYDKLIISPGANPIKPNMPGINSKRVFTLRSVPDTEDIKNFVDTQKPKSALIIGGGFIGLEMAENLHLKGVHVTILEKADQCLPPFDFDMAQWIHKHLIQKKVDLILKEGIAGFEDKDQSIIAKFESGKTLETDMVLLSIGVIPDTKLAKECGLAIGRGIIVNEKMETSDPNIYAIGDAIEVQEFSTHANFVIPLAGPANKQGRIVANNILGRHSVYKGTQGTAIVKVFDLAAACVGATEKLLKMKQIPYLVSITGSGDHAGYYPNSTMIYTKLIFNKKGTILGCQIVGEKGVDKRIDVIATAMRGQMTVYDLEELELAYAPPFGTAKDAVNFCGFVASNILQGDVKVVQWHQIQKLQNEKAFVLDVRTKQEYDFGHIPEAVHIDVNTVRDNLNKIPNDGRLIICICKIGLRAYRILVQHGYTNVAILSGGNDTWTTATYKL